VPALAALLASLLLAGGEAPPAGRDPFAYDRDAPIQVKELEVERGDGIEVRRLVLSGPPLDRELDVRLVRPAGPGPYPAVVYLHMYPGSNVQFLDEARLLAKEGVVCLLVEGLYPWHRRPVDVETDLRSLAQQMIELRRAIDLLSARKDVDPGRIAFVGMDYGAMNGAVLASLEQRLRGYVLMVPTSTWSGWNSILNSDTVDLDYARGMRPYDPLRRISQASAPLLLQFCKADRFVSRDLAEQLFAAAPEPKALRWYDGDHEVAFSAGRADRLEWLRARLGLPAAGAR
jgi:dienelactone hydrolase